MARFLFIDFYFWPSNPQDMTGFSFWPFFNVVVGSTVGFIGAYFLFLRNQKATKKRDDLIRKQNFDDKFRYFTYLALEVPNIIKAQVKAYKEFVTATLKNKFQVFNPEQILYTPLARLVENANHEFFFHAYLNHIPKDLKRNDAIKNFQEIYSRLDYFYKVLMESIISLKIHKDKIESAIREFKESIKEIEELVFNLITNQDLQDKHIVFFEQLEDFWKEYIRDKKDSSDNMEILFNQFTEPLKKSAQVIQGYSISEINQLLVLIKKADFNFNTVAFLSTKQAEEYELFCKKLMTGIDDFELRIADFEKYIDVESDTEKNALPLK